MEIFVERVDVIFRIYGFYYRINEFLFEIWVNNVNIFVDIVKIGLIFLWKFNLICDEINFFVKLFLMMMDRMICLLC